MKKKKIKYIFANWQKRNIFKSGTNTTFFIKNLKNSTKEIWLVKILRALLQICMTAVIATI